MATDLCSICNCVFNSSVSEECPKDSCIDTRQVIADAAQAEADAAAARYEENSPLRKKVRKPLGGGDFLRR